MKILIIDDNIDKISQIERLLKSTINNPYETDSAQCIQNAMNLLVKDKFDLAIVDILLPQRTGDDPLPTGGNNLLLEIYRKRKKINVPSYIVGLTQHLEHQKNFSSIWKVIEYDSSSKVWCDHLLQLINHILITKEQSVHIQPIDRQLLPIVYVEGETDKSYLEESISLFYPELAKQIQIKTQNNAGAKWVANQITSFAHQLQKDDNGNYIKAIGLLDSDAAGNEAKKDIVRVIDTANKNATFRLLQIQARYNPDLIAFYSKGCKIEMDIESLLPLEALEYAQNNNWLENRISLFIEHPKGFNYLETTGIEYLKHKGITDSQLVYTKKVTFAAKEKLFKYVSSFEDKASIYKNFKPLLDDIKNYLIPQD